MRLPDAGGVLVNLVRPRVAPAKLRLSDKGVRFIAGYEGFRSHPYNDAAGFATVGYGHLLRYGPVRPNDLPVSEAEGLSLLRHDAHKAADAVRATLNSLPLRRMSAAGVPLKRKLKQGEFDALVSLVFNLGAGVLAKGRTMGDALRSGNRRRIAAAFLVYDHADGKVLLGLQRRRAAESRLYSLGLYR